MIHFCDVRLTTTYELSSLEVCTSVPTTIQKALAQNRKRHLALASVQKEGESTALPAREKQNNGRQWKDHDEILGGCALHGDKRRFQRWSMFPSSSRGTTPSSETWRERRFDNCHCGIRDTAELKPLWKTLGPLHNQRRWFLCRPCTSRKYTGSLMDTTIKVFFALLFIFKIVAILSLSRRSQILSSCEVTATIENLVAALSYNCSC